MMPPMKKKSKLDAMSMPGKPSPGIEIELEMGPEEDESGDMSSELAGESEGETGDEPRMEDSEGAAALQAVTDEDLMAELRKRGLMAKAGKAAGKASEDSEYA